MARKHKYEEHLNHDAWAIPYGDLITLLMAFFVVMYSISSVNEGKYRTVAASLTEAFRGIPRSDAPVQVGDTAALTPEQALALGLELAVTTVEENGEALEEPAADSVLDGMAGDIRIALSDLIDENIVAVRSSPFWLEIEIQTDILFPSAVATLSSRAEGILTRVAAALKGFPNPIRVEGHTDNLPIRTEVYPSNWELSAARAASVVRLLMAEGVAPARLSVTGLGQYQPVESNDSAEGRERNRRVVLVMPASEKQRKQLQEGAAVDAPPVSEESKP